MADISDIQTQLTRIIAAAIYPAGTSGASAAGVKVKVYPGWPLPAQLDKDITAGMVNVSIWARGDGANTTRFPSSFQESAGGLLREVRRQTDTLQVSIWAPTPDARVAVAKVVDAALAGIRFLTMDDGSSARLAYKTTISIDHSENALIYRRDFLYMTEYATVIASVATPIAVSTATTTVVPTVITSAGVTVAIP
jgi:hypothetical protein